MPSRFGDSMIVGKIDEDAEESLDAKPLVSVHQLEVDAIAGPLPEIPPQVGRNSLKAVKAGRKFDLWN